MWQRAINQSGGGGGNVEVDYVGEFSVSTTASTAKTIDFSTGTYARSDYAELTADNFLVLPVLSTSNVTKETSRNQGNTAYWTAKVNIGRKNHEYNPTTGTFKFYGGIDTAVGRWTKTTGGDYTQIASANASLSYKVYVIKPSLDELAGIV